MPAVTPRLSRRSLLASTGSAFVAANALLGEAIAADDNPAAQVADRSSTIRVKSLRATPMGAKTYIKIETNHGISGWGEINALEPKTAALVTSMFELIDGENPTRIEYLWQKIYRAHRDLRGGRSWCTRWRASTWPVGHRRQALADARLSAAGRPTRDKIRVYPTPKAVKVPGHPSRYSGNPNEIAGLRRGHRRRPQAGRPRRHRDVRRPLCACRRRF